MANKRLMGFIAVSLASGPAWAVDLVIQPRFDAGIMAYRFEQESVIVRNFGSNVDLGQIDLSNLFPVGGDLLTGLGAQGTADIEQAASLSSVRIDDDLPFVNFGVTLFADRWYADLSYLRAFDGKSSYSAQSSLDVNLFSRDAILSVPQIPLSRYSDSFRTDVNGTVEFDRDEINFTIGYAVTEQFAVFGGYRRSTTDFDSRNNGSISLNSTLISADQVLLDITATGNVSSIEHSEFRQSGPFIGAAYTIPVDGDTLRGAVSFNTAVSFLDGRVKSSGDFTFSDVSVVDNLTGETTPLDADLSEPASISNFKGDTIGISLGLSWRGLTSIEGLTYGIGINAYDYQFDSDRSDASDINERAIRYQLGVAYQF